MADHRKIDEVVVSVFRAPKSYTGEDSLDISCHGGIAAGRAVMEALKSAAVPGCGAAKGSIVFRDALPGEFTFRAFMNGKLDLTRCESVMELVSARTETGRRHAMKRLCGSLETEIGEIKKMLVEVLAATEIYLDYSEDEITADSDTDVSGDEAASSLPKRDIALRALDRLAKLAASWQIERLYQEGVTVVIAGRPNAGKSSLINAMLKEDRSIFTETPGTTRDWIEAWVNIEGIPVRLVDTAGLRESDDPVEKIGVERSLRMMDEAEIVLYLIDGVYGFTDEDREFIWLSKKIIFVWNKVDLAPVSGSDGAIGVSAKTGEGITELNAAIVALIQGQLCETLQPMAVPDDGIVALGTERQKNLVDTAFAALEEAFMLEANEMPLDIIAPLLREAVNSLGEITGEVSTADILEEMFSRFCVGK
jgi:tRNA modification GTPase